MLKSYAAFTLQNFDSKLAFYQNSQTNACIFLKSLNNNIKTGKDWLQIFTMFLSVLFCYFQMVSDMHSHLLSCLHL